MVVINIKKPLSALGGRVFCKKLQVPFHFGPGIWWPKQFAIQHNFDMQTVTILTQAPVKNESEKFLFFPECYSDFHT